MEKNLTIVGFDYDGNSIDGYDSIYFKTQTPLTYDQLNNLNSNEENELRNNVNTYILANYKTNNDLLKSLINVISSNCGISEFLNLEDYGKACEIGMEFDENGDINFILPYLRFEDYAQCNGDLEGFIYTI